MLFTNDCVHVTNTATGALAPVSFAGQSYRADGTMLVNITTSAIPFSAAGHRGMTRWREEGCRIITKAAINAADLVLDNGQAWTLDGKQYAVTAGAAGATQKYLEGLPYDANGALKINEVA